MSAAINMTRRVTRALRGEDGQATVEYTLLGVCSAGMASLLLSWVNNSGLFGKLFGSVFKNIIGLLG